MLFIGPFFITTTTKEVKLSIMLAGLLSSDFLGGTLVVPNIAEMMRAVEREFPNVAANDSERTNSLLSGV